MSWLKRHMRTIAMVILAAILALSLTMTVVQQVQDRENAAVNAAAAELAGLPPSQSRPVVEVDVSAPVADTIPPDAAALLELNLAALRAVNPDVAGWIEIPGTELSYPIMQGVDNHYYLDHNWKQESNRGGSIFLEATCGADFSDFHTILYGHRMRMAVCSAPFEIIKSRPTGRSILTSTWPWRGMCTATRSFPPMSRACMI